MQIEARPWCSFKKALVGASLLFMLSPGLIQAQVQDRPKASPEQKRLEIFDGEWKYDGVVSDTPLGPGGKFAGKQTTRMVLDGLFQESRSEDKGVYGGKEIVYKGVNITWYDPVSKSYMSHGYDNDGFVSSGVMTVSGDAWTTTGTQTDAKGKSYKNRFTTTVSGDGKTNITKAELSADDGKTWIPYWESTAKKVGK
jgi:hypothetical protein